MCIYIYMCKNNKQRKAASTREVKGGKAGSLGEEKWKGMEEAKGEGSGVVIF